MFRSDLRRKVEEDRIATAITNGELIEMLKEYPEDDPVLVYVGGMPYLISHVAGGRDKLYFMAQSFKNVGIYTHT